MEVVIVGLLWRCRDRRVRGFCEDGDVVWSVDDAGRVALEGRGPCPWGRVERSRKRGYQTLCDERKLAGVRGELIDERIRFETRAVSMDSQEVRETEMDRVQTRVCYASVCVCLEDRGGVCLCVDQRVCECVGRCSLQNHFQYSRPLTPLESPTTRIYECVNQRVSLYPNDAGGTSFVGFSGVWYLSYAKKFRGRPGELWTTRKGMDPGLPWADLGHVPVGNASPFECSHSTGGIQALREPARDPHSTSNRWAGVTCV
jgi:hypothetical protein